MSKIYDQVLSDTVKHLKNYPNYLPYIGENYDKAKLKVLLIAESHYLHKKYDDQISSDKWYDQSEEVLSKLKDNLSGINTRLVVKDFNDANRNIKPYRIFLNLESAYQDVFEDAKIFKECAYINYFQRPAERNGKSIIANNRDHQYAFENLLILIETIKPDKVIFVSRKAFESYKSKIKLVDYSKINVVPHPACAWWNKPTTKYGTNNIPSTGREKFIRLISN